MLMHLDEEDVRAVLRWDHLIADTTMFKSVGLAIEDIAAARLVYEATRY